MRTLMIRVLIWGLLLAGCPAWAHGGHEHLMGTIIAVHAGRVEIRTREGKIVVVVLDNDTKYYRGKAPAQATDLLPGLRVVVDTSGSGDARTAREVRVPAAAGRARAR